MKPQTGKATNVDVLTVPVLEVSKAGSTYAQAESSVAQVLIAAKARISDPAKWGKGAPGAMPAPGMECAGIAIDRAASLLSASSAPVYAIFRRVNGDAVIAWNDAPERTHADVMLAFDRAIAAA